MVYRGLQAIHLKGVLHGDAVSRNILCLGAILHSTRRLLTLAVPLVTSRLPIAIGCGVAVA
ncbi:hypothetical protein I7I48_01489 [Histoplasma ohiense]|nr:hypothetical protein I7I48_01489 [Histoplasma ohiense (nom. inval.)]